MNRNRKPFCRRLRQLFCLLCALLMIGGWVLPAYGKEAVPAINSSGNQNIPLSVDPIRKDEGFSAVLYDNRNGLPTSEASAIAQTGDGFIWIGNYAGLIRYDGNTFVRLDSSTGIANVRCLYVDSRDRMWIGTNDSGVFLMSRGEIQPLDQASDRDFVSVRSFAEGEDKVLYVATASGIGYYDADLHFTAIQDERISGKTVREIRYGNDGLIYGLTQEEDLFTVRDAELVTFLSHRECRVKGIRSILPDPERPGVVYLGTEGDRVYYGELEKNFAAMGIREIAPLSSVESFEYIDREIWICTGNGVGKLNAEGFRRLTNIPMNHAVEHILTDHEGNLWFTSSKEGVTKIVPNRFADLFNRYDLPEAVVNATCMYGRQLFIGTDEGLIVVENGKRVDAIPLTKAVTASGAALEARDLLKYLDGVRIRSILRDSAGRLWISTWRRYGLIRYDHGEMTVFSPEDGLYSNRVRAVAEWEDGSMLVPNSGGVNVIQGDRVTAGYDEKDGLADAEILTIAEGFDHEMILGSDGDGIYVIGPDGTRHIDAEDGLKSGVILRIRRSRNHDVFWIVTGNSLAYMTPDYRVTTIGQFPYSNNYDLYENSRGVVWVLSSSGVYAVSGDQLLANAQIDAMYYGIASGLPYIATSNSFSELTPDGDLYISGVKGAIQLNIEKPFANANELKIAMPYIEIDGTRVFPDASGDFTVPHDVRKLTIHPFVISYSLTEPQISYRLEGFDLADTTLNRGELAPVSYTNLREGTYQFIIRADDLNGGKSVSASFRIVREKALSDGAAGTVIMDFISLVFMGGILIYTTLYRRRGLLEDRLFFAMILVNMIMAVAELASYLLEISAFTYMRRLMYADNTIFYIAVELFPYLLLLYADYRAYRDKARLRKIKLLYGIPFALIVILFVLNLKTGWIFSITSSNAYHSGPIDQVVFVPILFYFAAAMPRAYRINPRLVLLGILLIATRIIWDIWYIGISSTSFIYTLFLVCTHIHVMNRSMLNEEMP